MKERRVIITYEVETNMTISELKLLHDVKKRSKEFNDAVHAIWLRYFPGKSLHTVQAQFNVVKNRK